MNFKTYKSDLSEVLNITGEVIDRLLNLFFTSIETELNNLKNAILADDLEQIYAVSHKISGSASNLRLENITNLSYEIEICAKNHEAVNYLDMYDKLLNVFNETKLMVIEENSLA